MAFCTEQVRRAIAEFDMIQPDDRVLVAVSGGKDSLAVWDLLVRLGYSADGLYIAVQAQDTFSRLMAGALTLTFAVYVFVNSGMVAGLRWRLT